MPCHVAAVTTSRADWGHLRWVLEAMRRESRLRTSLIAIGAQLAEEFGSAVDEVERDGFEVTERVECLLSSDSDVGMAKTIGVATLGLADVLGRMRPDLLLLIADRYEMLAPAAVALALRIPIAHVEGGEISEGAIDDAVRNALTKMAHLHLTPTEGARGRVIAMGEEPWRVHRVGAPSLDALRASSPMAREALESRLGVEIDADAILVSYHPVTIESDTLVETDALFAVLEGVPRQVLFCFPNADAGARRLARRARAFCAARARSTLWVNLAPELYWGLLANVGTLLGNSSSGIMESASLALPTVNVGVRQQGRERARNVIDAEPTADAIRAALERAAQPAYRAGLAGMVNPYGDGTAGERIATILAEAPPRERLLLKRAVPRAGGAA